MSPAVLADVLPRDLVVAAAARIGLDQLPVGEHDHGQQQDDRGCDPGREGEERGPAEQEDEQHLLRRIGDG